MLRSLRSGLAIRNLGFTTAAASLVLPSPSNGEISATWARREIAFPSGGVGISTERIHSLQPCLVAVEGVYGPLGVSDSGLGFTDLEVSPCKEARSSETMMVDGRGCRAAVVVKVVHGSSSGVGMVEKSLTSVWEEGGGDWLGRWSPAKSSSSAGRLTFPWVWARIRASKPGFGLKSKTGQDWAWVDGPGLQAKKADFAAVEDVMARPNAKGRGMT